MLTSYNGWAASPDPQAINIVPLGIPGRPNVCPPGVKAGDVATVLGYVVAQFHKRVQPLGAGCWGYAYRLNRNDSNLSCHASGTAVDLNAPKHPNGVKGTFTRTQVATIHKILTEVDGTVRWGGDFNGTPDEMHFEIDVDPAAVRITARKLTQPPPVEDDMTPEDRQAIVADVVKALRPDLLRLARYLRGQENAIFNSGPAGLPEPKDCAG